jgi:DNA-binding Lrp family transcriptional regulator
MANESRMRVVTLAAHKVPEFKEEASKEWVIYGTDAPWRNRYPDYLLHLFNRSAKHYAIVNGKVDYIVGNGWSVDGAGLTTVNLARLQKFINEPNPDETLNEILAKVAVDLEIFGGFALEIIPDKKGGMAEIRHAEFAKYRVSKDGKQFFYSEDWKSSTPKDVETIPAFDWTEKPKNKQLLYVKAYHPQSDWYPLPPYLGAVPYIEIDYEIANFHLSSVKNGFVAGTMINFFNGQPTEEEQQAIEDKITEKFCGTDNANKILLNFNDSKEQSAEILRMDGNDFDKRFDILNDTVRQEIFTGHRIVDPALFGIQDTGMFTNRTQIRDSYELFKNTYVNGRQRFIESIFNGLASLAGFEKRLIIQDSEPISESFSEATKVGVMTRDEIRAELGLPPLSVEQVKTELKLAEQDDTDEVKLCEYFAGTGLSLDEYEVVKPVKKVRFRSNEEAIKSEELVKRYGFAEDAVLFGVLEELKKNPLTTYAALAEAFGIEVTEVATIIQELIYRNFLTIGAEVLEGGAMRALTITPRGTTALQNATPLEVTYQVAYRYVLSGEASGPEVLPTTRDFCRDMVAQSKNRVWTSKQIMDIGMGEDRNVWLRRGGFWTRKGTNVTTAYCRHAWEQVVVRKR